MVIYFNFKLSLLCLPFHKIYARKKSLRLAILLNLKEYSPCSDEQKAISFEFTGENELLLESIETNSNSGSGFKSGVTILLGSSSLHEKKQIVLTKA